MGRYLDDKSSVDVRLSEEERDMIYYQLSARKSYFEEAMHEASLQKNTVRVIECVKAIETIQGIQDKMIV